MFLISGGFDPWPHVLHATRTTTALEHKEAKSVQKKICTSMDWFRLLSM